MTMTLGKNRLISKLEKNNGGLFFSVMDNLNRLYTSSDPDDVIEFYSKFRKREDLIKWMKERPTGNYSIHEIDGDNDIIVVMTTADYNGEYARRCRDEIYKGLHMIFVESGGRGDYYINCGRNMNAGVRKAMTYNPKWVIISGDDMYKIDDVSVLRNELSKIDPREIDTAFVNPPGIYHSVPGFIGKPRFLYEIAILTRNRYRRVNWKIRKRFEANEQVAGRKYDFSRILYSKKRDMILTNDFAVLSSKFLESQGGVPYDDAYICGSDDDDLALRLKNRGKHSFINYKIGSVVGGTLGVNDLRGLRYLACQVYFSYKLDKGILQVN